MTIVTVKELSLIIKVSPKTIYQWAEMRQIPHFKLNGCLRFDLDEVLEWLQHCKREPLSGYNFSGRGPFGKEV
jgi:excisionase family DNA binding protein